MPHSAWLRGCDHPSTLPLGWMFDWQQGSLVIRKGHFNAGLWLGFFAMLMIHVGPLYSALQSFQSAVIEMQAHQQHQADPHAGHDDAAAAHAHHAQASGNEPVWVAALDLCGYCELLTLSPPLTVSVEQALPWYATRHFLALPEQPLLQPLRRSSGHPRAPPVFLG